MVDSFTVSQVSEVDSCSGIRSFDINRAFEISVPQRIPQVSKLRLVLGEAMARKRERRLGGRNTVRSGVPFSRYADGLKVKVDGSRSDGVTEFSEELASLGEGDTADALLGRGGGSSNIASLLGGRGSFGGRSGGFMMIFWGRTGEGIVASKGLC
jgi:hypothetical protein